MTRRLRSSYGLQQVRGHGVFAFRRVVGTSNDIHTMTRRVALQRKGADVVTLGDDNTEAVRRLADFPGPPKAVYLFVDTVFHDAFDHYAKESSIWLTLWTVLLAEHPNLQLATPALKGYKKLFFKAYGIPLDRVVTGPPFPEPNNLVYFPPLTSLHASNADRQRWLDLIMQQADMLLTRAGRPTGCPFSLAPTGVVFLQRGTKDIYAANNNAQRYKGQAEIAAAVEGQLGGTVVRTDDSDDFSAQVSAVSGARVVISNYGSATWFNTVFARNATVLVIDTNHGQHLRDDWLYGSLQFVFTQRCEIVYLGDNFVVEDVINRSRAALAGPPLSGSCGTVLSSERA